MSICVRDFRSLHRYKYFGEWRALPLPPKKKPRRLSIQCMCVSLPFSIQCELRSRKFGDLIRSVTRQPLRLGYIILDGNTAVISSVDSKDVNYTIELHMINCVRKVVFCRCCCSHAFFIVSAQFEVHAKTNTAIEMEKERKISIVLSMEIVLSKQVEGTPLRRHSTAVAVFAHYYRTNIIGAKMGYFKHFIYSSHST